MEISTAAMHNPKAAKEIEGCVVGNHPMAEVGPEFLNSTIAGQPPREAISNPSLPSVL